jgi:hypothetical protein
MPENPDDYPFAHRVGAVPVDAMPDEDQIEQIEAPFVSVPVDIGGPVSTRQLGALDGSIFAVVVNDTQGGKLINSDGRRTSVTICAFDQPIFIGLSLSEVQAANAAPIPKGVPVTIRNVNRLFARSATPAATAQITVIADQWTQ